MKLEKHKCYHCETWVTEKTGAEIEVFDSPFDESGHNVWIHTNEDITEAVMKRDGFDNYGQNCLDYLSDESWADFRILECPWCERFIYKQAPNILSNVGNYYWCGSGNIHVGPGCRSAKKGNATDCFHGHKPDGGASRATRLQGSHV